MTTRGDKSALQLKARRAFWRRIAGAVAAIVLLSRASAAGAQPASDFAQSINPLFQGVLTRPANLNNAMQYAAGASQAGDIESAISTYEQLLFYNPKLSLTRYRLGVLYYELGSYDMARGYLQTALQMPDLTPELKQRIDELLDVVDKKLQPDQFSGFAQTGLRYQTNAALGPSPQARLASGSIFNSAFFAKPDWNWFGTFGLDYVHDFEDQTGTTFEASVLGYDAQQFTLHQFDIGLMEIRAGPRFALSPGVADGITVKPYVVATGGLLADAPYFGGIGGGLTLHAGVRNVSLDPYAEVVRQSFVNSTLYPLASGMTGTLSTYGVRASGPIAPQWSWQTRVAYAHASDQFTFDSYDSYVADVWLPWTFSPGSGPRWTLIPTIGITQWLYGAPDPGINPLITARATEWRVGLGLEMPLWGKFILAALVQYRADDSNVTAFDMHDLAVTAGPAIKF